MLIEFSVRNFRSFRERQTLSMVAVPRLHKRENVFEPELKGEKGLKLLKVAVVYGPNASGKSNLLKALWTTALIAGREASAGSYSLPVQPFAFDPLLNDQPSEFEIHFVHQRTRYQFELAVTKDRIVTERLLAYPNGNAEEVYCRSGQTEADYVFGPSMESLKEVRASWIKLTPPRALFISQAVANSNDGGGPLGAPHAWLTGSILSLLGDMDSWTNSSLRLAEKSQNHSDDITVFLRELDVPITQLSVVKEKVATPETVLRTVPLEGEGLSSDSVPVAPKLRSRITLTHKSALGEADLPLKDESAGTRNLIGFWLPWTTRDPLDSVPRCILAVDELDSSLHPKIVEVLVAKHIRSRMPSQLIFTTHDTHLMDSKLLRRDQIWITERDINGATQLRSIHDFVGREGEDIEKRYYEGRYRGLPFVRTH